METTGLGVKRRHGPGAIDTDQPVGFRTADGGITQTLHLGTIAQVLEAILDGFFGHGLQPEALHRHFSLGILGDVIEDEFAFTSRVTGVDQAIDILAAEQLLQHLEARCGFLDGLQIKVGRNDGEVGESPLATFDFEFFRADQRQQVTNGRRQDVIIAFVVVVMLGKATERLGNIQCDRRFLGDDQLFAHGGAFLSNRRIIGGRAGIGKQRAPELV